ncbi:MAG: SGNH/GDSL hydrolase family protein [Anaerolineae bacterium]|nr:SGNH/GDSL hydrolase family protein [Anaerolineae bacterium]
MKLNFRMKIIMMLISVCLTLLGSEMLLRWLDPWGMYYFWDVADLWNKAQTHPNRIAVLPPGTYQFHGWTATQLEDFTRKVPASQGGPCTVVFVGDSFTWGHGVDDDEVWVNRVAEQLDGTTVINAGLDQYNSENVLRTLNDFPDADLFVYLVIGNDANYTISVTRQPKTSFLKMYLVYGAYYLTSGNSTGTMPEDGSDDLADSNQGETKYDDLPRFQADIAALAADGRVIFFGFHNPLSESLVPDYPITLIPSGGDTLSVVDRHPAPNGHRLMAEAMLPTIQAAVAERCPQ